MSAAPTAASTEDASAPTAGAPGRGVIHDIGYARYAGERRPPSTLWRVIMRHHLTYAWKTLWRFKPWLLSAVAITLVAGALMYVSQNSLFDDLRQRGAPLKFLDGILPMTFPFYMAAAFVLTMTVGAGVVARDQETGAFTFYFSRPVRPIDYVVGRLVGMTILTAIIVAAGPVLLALFRLGLSRSTGEAVDVLPWVGRALVVGLLAALAFAAVPLAVSALAGRRTLAIGAWAAYYLVGTNILVVLGRLVWSPLAALDPTTAVKSLALGLWDVEVLRGGSFLVSVPMAVLGLALQIVVAIAIFYRQIARTVVGAVGGAS